jgi:hypothetical protein
MFFMEAMIMSLEPSDDLPDVKLAREMFILMAVGFVFLVSAYISDYVSVTATIIIALVVIAVSVFFIRQCFKGAN